MPRWVAGSFDIREGDKIEWSGKLYQLLNCTETGAIHFSDAECIGIGSFRAMFKYDTASERWTIKPGLEGNLERLTSNKDSFCFGFCRTVPADEEGLR